MVLALAMPVLAGVIGFATDYTSVTASRSRLQQILDAAAISVAREMTVSPTNEARAQKMAERFVAANIPANTPYAISVTAKLVENGMAVSLSGSQTIATPFGLIERFAGVSLVTGAAMARVSAGSTPTKVCLISLGEQIDGGVYMHNGSAISAPGCIIQSNSSRKKAIILSKNSVLRTQLLCARGGITNEASSVEGAMVSDCPVMKDPLANKPEPQVPPLCKDLARKIKNATVTLDPGLYCDGLDISGNSKVTLNPGVYFFRGGALDVTDNSELTGRGVTLVFLGDKAYFRFRKNALIQLSAPTSGNTAGMLLWEATSPLSLGLTVTTPVVSASVEISLSKKKDTTKHYIQADRARELTGTIYLKKGLLTIDSTRPIADLSPYTIMVVEKLDLFDGPNMVLNSNYGGSAVPIPAGLGPIGGQQVRLGQ